MSVETEVAKAGFKVTLQMIAMGILGLLVLVLAIYLWWREDDYQEAKAYREAAVPVANVTNAATDALGAAQTAQQDFHFTIEDNRKAEDDAYEKLLQSDPNARAWADQPIPDSVRQSDGGAINRPEDN